VRLSSPGAIIFRQQRVGLRGQPIEVPKYRTMHENADSDTQWSVDNDRRVTRVGRFLRDSHLDELPQLWNVLKGEMSLVGPRPERPHFVEQFAAEIPGYSHRLRVPVGLTGLAQVRGLTGGTSISERARFDNRYIEDWSVLGDLRTLATLTDRPKEAAQEAAGEVAPRPRPSPQAGAA
jgi:lipopolysaccharide/colanic/teichoic acid biosynthesis glycosyltransferase